MEIWKDIKGYEGYYQVSNLGNVRSLDRFDGVHDRKGTKIKPNLKQNGYLQVGLRKHNKRKWFGVHRLVATYFLRNPNNKPQVNHIDCNKQNNNVSNLEWVTGKENQEHAVLYKAKILAKYDGFDVTSISKCCHKKLKTHKGYEWYFAKDFDKDIV